MSMGDREGSHSKMVDGPTHCPTYHGPQLVPLQPLGFQSGPWFLPQGLCSCCALHQDLNEQHLCPSLASPSNLLFTLHPQPPFSKLRFYFLLAGITVYCLG